MRVENKYSIVKCGKCLEWKKEKHVRVEACTKHHETTTEVIGSALSAWERKFCKDIGIWARSWRDGDLGKRK